jgi:hypothetical protein
MRKKVLIVLVFIICTFFAGSATAAVQKTSSPAEPVHRGEFQARMGIGRGNEAFVELNGLFREARRGHIVFGTIELIDSDRSVRFQGFFIQNHFLIQSAFRNNIINIFGRFNDCDEQRELYRGQWKGFINGIGRNSGWITAQFIE